MTFCGGEAQIVRMLYVLKNFYQHKAVARLELESVLTSQSSEVCFPINNCIFMDLICWDDPCHLLPDNQPNFAHLWVMMSVKMQYVVQVSVFWCWIKAKVTDDWSCDIRGWRKYKPDKETTPMWWHMDQTISCLKSQVQRLVISAVFSLCDNGVYSYMTSCFRSVWNSWLSGPWSAQGLHVRWCSWLWQSCRYVSAVLSSLEKYISHSFKLLPTSSRICNADSNYLYLVVYITYVW